MTTFEPTYETLLLSKRIEDGDVLAIKDLWEHLHPGQTFDTKRPLAEASREIGDIFNAYTEAKKAEADAKAAQAKIDATAESVAVITQTIDIIIDILKNQRKRR